ncbi:MAG: UDP-2,4-diacetamido-2,4,6-trideoxy-beta-L-altropyranose hydrolase [Methylotenera sp.]
MKIAFRVDASMQIGTGHVMRCMTLADALADDDTTIHFICKHLPGSLEKMLQDKGFDVSILPVTEQPNEEFPLAHSDWLGVAQEVDARATLALIQNQGYDWLIIDHYALDIRWEKVLRPVVKKIMVIDDLADREHDCDVLLDQNLYADQETRYKGKVPNQCRTLIGPRYALLRKEFAEYRKRVKPREGKAIHILVFFGGVDANDFTTKTVLALSQITEHNFLVDVVIGDQHPNKEEIGTLCQRLGYSCYVQTNKMAELMANADFSIGAGGGAVWERACLMLPTLSIPIAQNQVKQLGDIALTGVTYIFDAEDYTAERIKKHVEVLIENNALRNLLSVRSAEIVDCEGVYRVAQALHSEIVINLRQANKFDEKLLFEWRNHPKIRAVSFNKNEITWDQHHNWFSASLSNSNRVLLIGEYNNKSVGVVRFDLQNDDAEISIYLVQENENNGLGLPLIRSAEKWICKHRRGVKKLNANVLETNKLSQQFFIKAGYTPETRLYCKEL